MASSILEQYRISDLLEWYEKKTLIVNPEFQRRSVWTMEAKAYLIDTILRRLPIPKVYIRTKVNLVKRTSYREVVDGQQRLRAVFEFATNGFPLTRRTREFEGYTYSNMPDEHKEIFLSYTIGVEQLINASDSDVLEVFSRLNSYTLPLNAAEQRHAKFQGEFRWAVYQSTQTWDDLWENYPVLPVRQRLRMADDSLMAEMFGIIIQGVTDGGASRITRLYERYDKEFPEQTRVARRVDEVIKFITKKLGDVLRPPIAGGPHFLMLFAAVAHALFGIPDGELGNAMPRRDQRALSDMNVVKENLEFLNLILDSDDLRPQGYIAFREASRASTQRMSSRSVRFPIFYRALLPERLS